MPVRAGADVVVPERPGRRGRRQSRADPLLYSFRDFKFRASFVPVRPAAELGRVALILLSGFKFRASFVKR